MRLFYPAVLFLVITMGCAPDSYEAGRKHLAQDIEDIKLGSGHRSLHCPPLDLFETASKDASFVKNLRELTLCGRFDKYSNIPLESFVNLERVGLVDTKQTVSYLKVLPPGIKTLAFDRTDLTSGSGTITRVNDPEFRESLFQALSRFQSVEKIFICPWHKRLTPKAAEALPKLQALKKLDLEWATEEDVLTLQEALPNCKVRLITEH